MTTTTRHRQIVIGPPARVRIGDKQWEQGRVVELNDQVGVWVIDGSKLTLVARGLLTHYAPGASRYEYSTLTLSDGTVIQAAEKSGGGCGCSSPLKRIDWRKELRS